MIRTVHEVARLDDLTEFEVIEPVRLIFISPRRGGPRLAEIRRRFSCCKSRFSATPTRVFADLDPGGSQTLIALDMIARSDAAGLERAILSALPYVDEIVVGIDGRSDEETKLVAECYADIVHVFGASDIGLSEVDWAADKIHFANARNIGRSKVRTPWVLYLDTDEYLAQADDLRRAVVGAGGFGAFEVKHRLVADDGSGELVNCQMLARASYRWRSVTHNQLMILDPTAPLANTVVVSDLSLRKKSEIDRRLKQRDDGIEALASAAVEGDLASLFHLAKHKLSIGDEAGIKLAQDYRFRAELNGPLASERALLAFEAAMLYYKREDYNEATVWAIRTLLDGPVVEAFCLLGNIAEDLGDLNKALAWYEAACVVPDDGKYKWTSFTGLRWGRRAALKWAVTVPKVALALKAEAEATVAEAP